MECEKKFSKKEKERKAKMAILATRNKGAYVIKKDQVNVIAGSKVKKSAVTSNKKRARAFEERNLKSGALK